MSLGEPVLAGPRGEDPAQEALQVVDSADLGGMRAQSGHPGVEHVGHIDDVVAQRGRAVGEPQLPHGPRPQALGGQQLRMGVGTPSVVPLGRSVITNCWLGWPGRASITWVRLGLPTSRKAAKPSASTTNTAVPTANQAARRHVPGGVTDAGMVPRLNLRSPVGGVSGQA